MRDGVSPSSWIGSIDICAKRSTASCMARELDVDHAGSPVIPAGREVGSLRSGEGRAAGREARDGPAALFRNFGCIKLGATACQSGTSSQTHDQTGSERSRTADGRTIENP